jgi:hypothetical protein
VEFPQYAFPLRESAVHLDAATASAGADVFAISFAWGEGRVVAFSTFAFLRNDSIGTDDHAALGLEFATAARGHGDPVIFLKPPKAELMQWLRNEAWTVLVAAALLLLAWLARVVPRFGPLAPDPQPVRRRLTEHIAASGRFLWSRGERAYLLAAARERAWQTATRRFARLRALAPEAAAERLADVTAVSRLKTHRALAAAAETEKPFVAAIAALRDIEARLGASKPSTREIA